MKRFLILSCVAVLLLSTASAALASESYWAARFKAGWYDGTQMTYWSAVTIGARPDPIAGSTVTPTDYRANIALGPQYVSSEWADSDNPPPYQFTLSLAVGADFPATGQNAGQVYITAWTPDNYLGVTGRGMPSNYTVRVQGQGVDVTWTQAQLNLAVDPVSTGIGPVGFWYSYGEKSSSWAEANDFFTVTVNAVPEAGGLLALGSGVLGMAGFVLRRRRA